MKLFRRSRSIQPDVPPEVAEYYQAEQRNRKGKTWMLLIITLLVTIAIVVGMFLVGRWVVDSIRNRSSDAKIETSQHASENESSDSSVDNGDQTAEAPSPAPSEPERPQPSDDRSNEEDPTVAPNSDDRSTTESQPNTTTPTAPSVSDDDALTNTGPGETMLVGFVGGSIVAYAGYRFKLARR